MKNYRPVDNGKQTSHQKFHRQTNADRKTYSPNNPHAQNRLNQNQHLAKKAKEQLKQFQNKRKYSPDQIKYIPPNLDNIPERPRQYQTRLSPQQKTLLHTYSQKLFKRESVNQNIKASNKQEKGREGRGQNYQTIRQEKVNGILKPESPKKKNYIDSQQYKKLHQKLDQIEHKITDMKKNLQKKKEEKIKLQEIKIHQKETQQKNALKDLVSKVPQKNDLHTFHYNPYSPRHNVYYVSQLIRAYKDEQSLARQHLLNSLNILKGLERSRRLSQQQMKKVVLNLPKKKGYQDKKTIVFDLDETLIHCNDNLTSPYDVKLPIKFPTGQLIEAGINIRPYSKELLKNLSKYFEIIVFTASHSCYANVVIDYLDPNRQWVHHRLFREHCYLSPEGMYVKDLRILNRDLKSMVLVDNAAYSYAYQLQNGIPIFPYYHGQIDFQLKMLQDYLMKMIFAKDFRELNESTFKLTKYKHYYIRPEKLVQQLYINQ